MLLSELEMTQIAEKVSMGAASKVLDYMNEVEGWCEKAEALPCVGDEKKK